MEECLSVGVRGDAGTCVTVWVDGVRDIGPKNTISHCSTGEKREAYALLVLETLHLSHREMLYALSLFVRETRVLASLMRD